MSYSIKPIQFSNYHDLQEKQRHEQILFGKERQDELARRIIDETAKERAYNEARKGLVNAAEATIASDIFIKGATQAGEFAAKTAASAKQAGMWGSALGTVMGYDAVVSKIADSNDSIKEATQKHPLAMAFLYLTGGVATLTGVDKLYRRAKSTLANRYPKQTEALKGKLESVKSYVDNSFVNKEIVKPVMKLSEKAAVKMPTIAKAAKTAAPLVPYAILGAAAIKTVTGLKADYLKEREELAQQFEDVQKAAALKASFEKINELDQRTQALYTMTSSIARSQDIFGGKTFSRFDNTNEDDDLDESTNEEAQEII